MDGRLFRLVGALLLVSAPAFADAVNNEWYSSTRALSMGNVGISSAEDSITAMFYNPGALTRNKHTVLEIFNPQLEIGKGVFTIAGSGAGYGKQLSLKDTQPLLMEHPHKASYMGYSLFPNVHAQNFGFGILWRQEAVSYINSQDKLEYHSRYLLLPTMGIAMNLMGNHLRLGVGFRAIQITENNRKVDPDADGVGYKKDPEEGFGIGADVGALFSLPWSSLPTLGVVARNVGDSTFTGGAPFPQGEGIARMPGRIKMTYDGGFSISPKIGQRDTLIFAIDYRDIQNVSYVDTRRHVNIGLELGFKKSFFLRTGFGRGYWTAGFGLASKYGSFDFGTYGEELDARNFQGIQDRRYSLRFGSKF
jgi:hypothetical protein